MQVKDVCAAMEAWAPSGLAYPWDAVGLRIGDPTAPVTGVLTALSVTREAFEQACATGANLIVSHHPFPWTPLATLCPTDPETRLALDLVHANIACYAAHTNLDVVFGGVNHMLAKALGVVNVSPLLPVEHAEQVKLVTYAPESHWATVRDALCEAGTAPGALRSSEAGEERRIEVTVSKARLNAVMAALKNVHPHEQPAWDLYALTNRDPDPGLGVRGELPAPMRLEALARHVRHALELDHVRLVGDSQREVFRAGLIAGSGGGEIPNTPADIDVLITGDVKYHQAMTALDRGVSVIDAGHHGAEKGIADAMARYLNQHLAGVTAHAYTEPDPFRAVTG